MKDNMKNFREASDLILKNIYVTDELKRKTMVKCTDKREVKIKPVLAASFSAALIVSFGIFNYLFHKPAVIDTNIAKSINQEYKNSSNSENAAPEIPKTADRDASVKPNIEAAVKPHTEASESKNAAKGNTPVPQEKNKEIAMNTVNNIPEIKSTVGENMNTGTDTQRKNEANISSDNVPQSKLDTANSKSILNGDSNANNSANNNNSNKSDNSNSVGSLAVQVHPSLASAPEPLTVKQAEEYFGSKILLPAYIPEGFKLTDISEIEDKEKCIKLKYSSDSAYFEILQSKNLSKLEGTKTISIQNSTAYINSVKDEGTNTTTTNISWIEGDIQYSLSGSLPEDSMIKIAKFMN